MDKKIQITVAGTGYVGLSIATLLSQHHKVYAVDIVPEKVEGAYQGTASAEGYSVDGVTLNLSDKDQKWLGLKDTFHF